MCWTLIHYFHKYFLSSYYILDTSPVLDAEGSVVNKIDKNPCFCGTTFPMENRQYKNDK